MVAEPFVGMALQVNHRTKTHVEEVSCRESSVSMEYKQGVAIMENQPFFQFLKYCLNDKQPLPEHLKLMDWEGLFRFCQQQAIISVAFWGIERLQAESEKLDIPKELLLQWFAISEQIRQRNRLMNRRCVELSEMLEKDGFDSCILKGQGNALMYPNPLTRTPGDIDIWVMSQKNVIGYVRKKNPKAKACYHHIDYGNFKEVEVEVHYRPTFMNNLIMNRRMQEWVIENARPREVELPEGAGCINVPSVDFNIIFQLSHMYGHVVQSGLGLRQMMDYFYLLKKAKGSFEINKEEWAATLKRLGLYKFAGAVMYIMQEVLGLEEQYLIVPMDERQGKFLLDEILRGGNFGFYKNGERKKAEGRVCRNLGRLKRDLRLVRYYPSECLWEPVFRIWHFFWRLRH